MSTNVSYDTISIQKCLLWKPSMLPEIIFWPTSSPTTLPHGERDKNLLYFTTTIVYKACKNGSQTYKCYLRHEVSKLTQPKKPNIVSYVCGLGAWLEGLKTKCTRGE